MKLRRTDDISKILILHARCFPGDDVEPATQHWLLEDEEGKPAGFCSAYRLTWENGIYLTRAGLLPRARGRGLQRRMIRTRLRWGRDIGADFAITYTSLDNGPSIANLIRSGFSVYQPADPWVDEPVLYFFRSLAVEE